MTDTERHTGLRSEKLREEMQKVLARSAHALRKVKTVAGIKLAIERSGERRKAKPPLSQHLYRYSAVVRLDPGNSLDGTWSEMEFFIQIPAGSVIEATQKAAAIGKQQGLMLIGPL